MSQMEEMNSEQLQALMARVEHAIENHLALEPDDMRLLLNAIHTLMTVQSRLEDKDITLNKLRKLLGMIDASEKRNSSGEKRQNKRSNSSNPSQGEASSPKTVQHTLETVKKGDPCPECPNGKLVKASPKILLRVSGNAPLTAIRHIVEQLQCNLCGAIVSAPLPQSVVEDGESKQQYGYSARSIMAIQKHFSGIPYYHQQTLNGLFGCAVTASTIFDQCERLANDIMPCYRTLKQQAANSCLIYVDDTHHRILNQKPENRPKRNGKGSQLRKGVYTSGLIGVLENGETIHLYETSLGHAGELLDDIFHFRDPDRPPPIIMADAASRNLPKPDQPIRLALCNAHGRRQFIEVENQFPDEVDHVIGLYANIWQHESETQDMTPAARLAHHQTHSLPEMVKIQTWCESYLSSDDREVHSGLGRACRYYLTHFDGLTQFCQTAGAPIDNNRMEQGLKTSIRNRKNSHFYKTKTGADIANVLTSVITTAYRNDVNPFDYLNLLQRNRDQVKSQPEAWMPWGVEVA